MNKLIDKLNLMAEIELNPDKWIIYHCPKGCSKGGYSAKYFDFNCSHCGSELIIDKILAHPPKRL